MSQNMYLYFKGTKELAGKATAKRRERTRLSSFPSATA